MSEKNEPMLMKFSMKNEFMKNQKTELKLEICFQD